MSAPGDKGKLVNLVDNLVAERSLHSVHTIELVLTQSPRGVKCGAIVLFRANTPDPDEWERQQKENEKAVAQGLMQHAIAEHTETMAKDPELFRETDGKWLVWAIDRVMTLFDEMGSDANICIKCPKLKIRDKIPRARVVSERSDLRALFATAWEIDRLLALGFSWDPWGEFVRRGRIGADMRKR